MPNKVIKKRTTFIWEHELVLTTDQLILLHSKKRAMLNAPEVDAVFWSAKKKPCWTMSGKAADKDSTFGSKNGREDTIAF